MTRVPESAPGGAAEMADRAGIADLHAAAEAVWQQAQHRWPDLTIDVLPEVGSTNAHVMGLGRQGLCSPVVAVAWRQTAGRGRAGRTWDATPGAALTFSVGLPMDLAAVPGGGQPLSLAVGLWVADALEATAGLVGRSPIRLKWPNDLWVESRKVGGILIEAAHAPGLTGDTRWVVIGIGLNLRASPATSGTAVETSRADLADWGVSLTPGEALRLVTPAILNGAAAFCQHGFGPLQARYGQRDALRGRPVALWRSRSAPLPSEAPAEDADECGVAQGVDTDGALLVASTPPAGGDRGTLRRWTVGEVSVRPARL